MTDCNNYLSQLTNAQRAAVTHKDGPLLILAGPGSGKTRVITCRIAWLIEQGVAPWNILAVTFTNKAANEMRERLAQLAIPRGSTIGTFHALAARLLREFATEAQLSPDFSIYDDTDQKAAMRETLKALELDTRNFPPARMLNRISHAKNNLLQPEDLLEKEDFFSNTIGRIYQRYQQQLEQSHALDFDDLLTRLAFLLRDNQSLRETLNKRYRYVLVDEYQDTNQCQYQISRGLSLSHRNLCATGDPDQSIYGWRGADIGNILAFEEDYPEAVVIRLEENFRSTPQVLALADQLINRNTQRKEKKLFTGLPDGRDPELLAYADEQDEANGLAEWIQQCRQDGYHYRDIAVFYRVNSMSRVLEEQLLRHRIPYQVIRGLAFLQRSEIKDLLAYLRVLVNPDDQAALKRCINTPTRGIGATTVNRLIAHAEQHHRPLGELLESPGEINSLGAAAQKKLAAFGTMIRELRSHLNDPPSSLIRRVYERSTLNQYLEQQENGDEKQANVDELIASAGEFETLHPEITLVEYLQELTLMSDTDTYDEQAGQVSLMTLHAAKGLEFPAVRIVGLEEGLLPHSRSMDDDKGLEEERRLLFVGMTRAKQLLTLSYAFYRTIHGQTNPTVCSPFLHDLDTLNTAAADNLRPPAPSFSGGFSSGFANALSPGSSASGNQFAGNAPKRSADSGPVLGNHRSSTARSNASRGRTASPLTGDKPRTDSGRLSRQPGRAGQQQAPPHPPRGNSGTAPATTQSPQSAGTFQPGQRVRHPSLGVGRVIDVKPAGENTRIIVQFLTGGRKTLVQQYAKLEHLDFQ